MCIASNITLIRNNSATMTTVIVMSLYLPERSLMNTKLNTPKQIPLAILYVNGMNTMVMNAGRPSDISLKSIFTTDAIIKNPMVISGAAVAPAGTILNRGKKNRASTKKNAVDIAVSPVRPPAATPDALSTYEVTVLVPSIDPTVVPIASANRAFFI